MRPSRIIPLCLFALGLMALAAHGAPDAGYDASMSLPVAAPVVAPLQVVQVQHSGLVTFCKGVLVMYWPALLFGVLLLASEVLSLTKLTKANGVLQLLLNVVRRFAAGRPGVGAVEAALEGGPLVPVYSADGSEVVGYRRKDPPVKVAGEMSITERQVIEKPESGR